LKTQPRRFLRASGQASTGATEDDKTPRPAAARAPSPPGRGLENSIFNPAVGSDPRTPAVSIGLQKPETPALQLKPVMGFGFWVTGFGLRVLGYELQVASCGMSGVLVTCHSSLAFHHSSLTTAPCRSSLATRHASLVTRHLPCVTRHLPFATRHFSLAKG